MSSIRITRGLAEGALALVTWTAFGAAQDTTRVSVDSAGTEANGASYYPAISADGQTVAFYSWAYNLVSGDTNGWNDVFVHDRRTGTTERMTVDSAGTEANDRSYYPTISGDGQIVAYFSLATNLVSGDTNSIGDVFVRDRQTGTTERISVDSAGTQGNAQSSFPSISSDGQIVAFDSYADNLVAGDTNGYSDVFVHDRQTGMTERVSVDSAGAEGDSASWGPSISADGRFVAFTSFADNLVPGDINGRGDVFVHDRQTGTTERVSVDSAGLDGNDLSWVPSISGDGQIVAFTSYASNLVSGDTNGYIDVFVRDRQAGTTERVSVRSNGSQGTNNSWYSSISANGQIVAFYSDAPNLIAHDTNARLDVFVHGRLTGRTKRVSVDSAGNEGNNSSDWCSISADGQAVAFPSDASNLVSGDTNRNPDIFVHELCSNPASWSNYGSGYPGTNGVPSFTSQQNPVLGTTITLDLANSYGTSTVALLFVGFQQTSIHSSWGGDLLVVPTLTTLVPIASTGDSFTGDLPSDWRLCSFAVDLQAIEDDPGAAKGVSFTPGLQLILGE